VIGAVLVLVIWLALLAAGVGYLLVWLGRSLGAVVWIRQRRRAGTFTGDRVVVAVEVGAMPLDDAGATSTMYVSLMDDGREVGKRQRVKVVAAGDGLRVVEPAYFADPDRQWDEVAVYDRPNEAGGFPLARVSRWLVSSEQDGTVVVGERDCLP
jgi:hypothetical protein